MNKAERVSHVGDSIENAKEAFVKALDEAAKGGWFMAAVWGSKDGRMRLMGRTTFKFEKEDFDLAITQLDSSMEKEKNAEDPLPAPLPRASDLPFGVVDEKSDSPALKLHMPQKDSPAVVGDLVDRAVGVLNVTDPPSITIPNIADSPTVIPTNDPENPFININTPEKPNEKIVE